MHLCSVKEQYLTEISVFLTKKEREGYKSIVVTIHIFESMLTPFGDILKYLGQDPTECYRQVACYIHNRYLERGELTEPQCNLGSLHEAESRSTRRDEGSGERWY